MSVDDMDFDEFFIDLENDFNENDSSSNLDKPSAEHIECLRKNFGHKNFRPNQWKIISSIINEKRDNCAVMTTGYGKSLCYQFPSVYLELITIVVSPLISLMEDQVLSLQLLNIKACFLGTAQKDRTVLNKVMNFEYLIIYLTPEFITSDIGAQLLKTLSPKLCLIAIDEAHCISKWGHDFRKSFLNIGCVRKILPKVPILAMTATATEKVQDDLISYLHLRNPQIVCTGFDRPNLEFNVRRKSNDIWNDIGPCLQLEKTGSIIVYCLTRNLTEEIASIIRGHGFICESYHAGLSINNRKDIHRKFVRDEIQIIVATIAFGMGIDKPDVRMVIHYGACQDIESYYQEVGRAGRDGMPAKCILFYSTKDFEFHKFMREKTEYSKQVLKNLENLSEKMFDFISTTYCRRLFILQYFEGNNVKKNTKTIKNNCCDNCKNDTLKKKSNLLIKYKNMDENGLYDFTTDAELLLKAIEVFGGYSGLTIPILFLRGSKDKKVPQKYYSHALYGAGKNKSVEWWKDVSDLLILNKYIEKRIQNSKFSKNAFVSFTACLTSKSYSWLKDSNKSPIKLKLPQHMIRFLEPERNQISCTDDNSQINSTKNSKCLLTEFQLKSNKMKNDQELLKLFYKVRTLLAGKLDVMPYMIVSNRALHQLAEKRPKNLEDLKNQEIDGFSEIKIKQFGPNFIECILEFENELLINHKNDNNNKNNILSNTIINPSIKYNCDDISNNATSSSSLMCLEGDYKKSNEQNINNENINEDNDYWESDIEIDYEKIDTEIKKLNDSISSLTNHNDCNDDVNIDLVVANKKDECNNLNENNLLQSNIINEINDWKNCDFEIIEQKENEQKNKIDNNSKSSSSSVIKRKISYQVNKNVTVYENSSDDDDDDDDNDDNDSYKNNSAKKRNIPSWMISSSSSVSKSIDNKRKLTKKSQIKNIF